MTDVKRIIIVWSDEDYSNRAEAEKDGATYRTEMPDNLDHSGRVAFLEGFREAMKAGGDRFKANTRALAYEVIQLKPFTATARVLEWNDYTATVYAESEEDAYQLIKNDNITSYSPDDVSWGMEGAPSAIGVVQKDVHIEAQ